LPTTGPFRVLVGTNGPDTQFLGGIATAELVNAAQSILKSA